MAKVKVIGAGFSGLTLAYYLVKNGLEVEVFEQNPDVGGLIHSLDHSLGLVETAANAILWTPSLQSLCDDLKIKLLSTEPSSRRRFIFAQGQARRWPLSFGQSLFLFFKIIASILRPRWRRPKNQESVENYISRVLTRSVLEQLVAPGLQGIYAGDVRRMSARLLLGRFTGRPAVDIHGLAFKKKKFKARGSVAPENGMGSLLEALKKELMFRGVKFNFSSLAPSPSDVPQIWATAAWSAAAGLKAQAPDLAAQLSHIEILGLVSATVFYDQNSAPLRGFGVLFRRGEGIRALGVLLNEFIFKNRSSKHSETWILGGAQDPELPKLDDAEILKFITQDREKLYGIRSEILGYQITRWPRALPHYTLELEGLLEKLKIPPGLYLHGNYLGRIGLSQILERSQLLAQKLAMDLKV